MKYNTIYAFGGKMCPVFGVDRLLRYKQDSGLYRVRYVKVVLQFGRFELVGQQSKQINNCVAENVVK